MGSIRALVALMMLAALLPGYEASAETQPPDAVASIEEGSIVRLEYTLTDDGGKFIESNKDKDPLVYTQGSGHIIRGLEKALLGMHEGEAKHVTVPPEEAYGAQNPQAVLELPKDRVPPDVEVGMWLERRNRSGQPIHALVKEIKGDVVVLDLNHPLAGKTLNFDIKVLAVTPARAN